MNVAPAITVPASDALVAEALARLGAMAERAGQPAWTPPEVATDSERLARTLALAGLDHGEALVVALLLACECDAVTARLVATIQAPVGGARVLAGLAAALFAPEGVSVASLWSGAATRAGLIAWGDEAAPLPERSLAMPAWLAAGLAGFIAPPPGVATPSQPAVILPEAAVQAVAKLAAGLAPAPGAGRTLLVIRANCAAEGEALAQTAAAAAGLELCHLADATAIGLASWLVTMRRLAMVHRSAGPGESIDLAGFDALAAPLLLVTGRDGHVVSARAQREWHAALPDAGERASLWRSWGLDAGAATLTAARYRQSAGRIAELGRGLANSGEDHSQQLARLIQTGGGRIDALARRTDADVRREDIVLPAPLGTALDRLRDRIALRNRLHHGLGPTITARYRPGVRALFTGASGTGKTLAAHWLAREAGLPCYRVDLAALTSKWIGETEKNLSSLLDTAEQGDVLLFFDEADSLFGARTDVGDSNDRFANAQTNFLLQRIEEFEGIALLATNSRDRFDPAFVRRLDMVLEFPLPDTAARRLLWDRHLGDNHAIPSAWLDLIGATVDLAGGHVRNIVLAAASRAMAEGRPIDAADLRAGIEEEYGKLGRSPPVLPPC